MRKITDNELFEFYIYTLNKCGLFLLNESDEIIGYSIFEEFDIGATTFLYKDNLNKLKDAGLISSDIVTKSLKLREMFIAIQNSNKWNLESVRTLPEWHKLFELSDEIKKMIACTL